MSLLVKKGDFGNVPLNEYTFLFASDTHCLSIFFIMIEPIFTLKIPKIVHP